jgi:hypothetical protein
MIQYKGYSHEIQKQNKERFKCRQTNSIPFFLASSLKVSVSSREHQGLQVMHKERKIINYSDYETG